MNDNEFTQNPNNLSKYLEQLVSSTQDAKVALCEHEGGPADGMPLMMWITEEHGLAVCAMPLPERDGISMPEIIDYGLRKAFVDMGKPMYGAFIGEALVRRTSDTQEVVNHQRGDLQRSFQKDPMSVSECLTILAFDGTGEMRHACVTYKYNDFGMPEFDEPLYQEEKPQGAIAETVDDFFEVFVRGW
jgi:hypothetical protein